MQFKFLIGQSSKKYGLEINHNIISSMFRCVYSAVLAVPFLRLEQYQSYKVKVILIVRSKLKLKLEYEVK